MPLTFWLEIVSDVAAILAAVAVILTATFVWRQTRLQALEQGTDERRFLRESIGVIHDTLQADQFVKARAHFFSGPHRHDHSDLSTEDKGAARYILSIYSLLARMIKHGAIDEDILRDYWGTALYRDWDRLENYVSGERLRSQSGQLFTTTQHMVNRWQKTGNGAKR